MLLQNSHTEPANAGRHTLFFLRAEWGGRDTKGQALPLKAQPPPVRSSSACLPQLVVSAPFCFLYSVFHPHPTPSLGRCSLPPYRASEGLLEQNSCLTPALCTPRGPLGDNDNNQPALTDHSNYATNCVCVFSCLLSLQSGSIYYLSILQMRKKIYHFFQFDFDHYYHVTADKPRLGKVP